MTFSRSAALAVLAVSLTFAASVPAAAQTTAPAANGAATIAKLAPADEYFGPLKLSIVGIRNSIAQTTLRLDSIGLDGANTYKSVALVEASVREWEKKYPDDAWLPRTILGLHRAYCRIASEDASLHAVDVAAWLLQKYPDSDEAHGLRAEIAGQLAPLADASATASNQ